MEKRFWECCETDSISSLHRLKDAQSWMSNFPLANIRVLVEYILSERSIFSHIVSFLFLLVLMSVVIHFYKLYEFL